MKLLLDSHALIWAVDSPDKLGPVALAHLQDLQNELHISAAVIWEVAIKCGLGKLQLSLPYATWMSQAIADLGLVIVPITVNYAAVQANLQNHHRDPFDRLLIAQAQVESMPIVSDDSMFDQYGVSRIW